MFFRSRRRLVIIISITCIFSIYLLISNRFSLFFASSVKEVKKKYYNERLRLFKYDYKPKNSVDFHPLHWKKDIVSRPIELINLTAPVVPSTTTLIILVPVLPAERGKRDIIRSLWASKDNCQAIRDGKITVIFFMAARSVSRQIREEVAIHEDILVVYGFEEYRRLVYKFYFGYKWVNYYYSQLDVAKVDGDVLFLPDNFYEAVTAETRPNTATGHLYLNSIIVRDETHKWYISPSRLNGTHYPPYLLGYTYFIKPLALAKIVKAASDLSMVYENEDAFFTGTCTQKAGVQLVDNENIIFDRPSELKCDEEGRPLLISYTRKEVASLVDEYHFLKEIPCDKLIFE